VAFLCPMLLMPLARALEELVKNILKEEEAMA
jgi:hypothetical protein